MEEKNSETIDDVVKASSFEWLETTGTGGYAFSTSRFINTRRYHGLLVAGEGPDDSRSVLLSRCDEVLHVGAQELELGTRLFVDKVAPNGYRFVTSESRSEYPATTYTVPTVAGETEFTKSVLALHDRDVVLVRYDIEKSPEGAWLELQPFVALRNHNELLVQRSESMAVTYVNQTLAVTAADSGRSVTLSLANSSFDPRDEWHRGVVYPEEKARGYDWVEDLFLPGVLHLEIEAGQTYFLVVSRGESPLIAPAELWNLEIGRRAALVTNLVRNHELHSLTLAAEQFLVRGLDRRLDVVAGYPWFTCWARDTMISLPGLCLATGWYAQAREILLNWAGTLSEGMLPNRLGVGEVKYNTVDGTLWYVVACYRYIQASQDGQFLSEELYQDLLSIVAWHKSGTRYGIKMDADDGLVYAGSEQTQLTWMDACYEGRPVTPRWGKAVEINALWYNVLCIMAVFAERQKDTDNVQEFSTLAALVRRSFREKFWLVRDGYLADLLQGDHQIKEIRPNQLFALSLPFALLEQHEGRRILAIAREHLLTEVGMRTLSPGDLQYIGQYKGSLEARDNAYHQGTVWPWLLLPYLSGVLQYEGEAGRAEVESLFDQALGMLQTGARGSISEVFDGDEPRADAGCVAQAWSVSALLEIASSLGWLSPQD